MENALWDYFETNRDAGQFSDEKIDAIMENDVLAGTICRKFMLEQDNAQALEWFKTEVRRYKKHLELRRKMDERHEGKE